MFLETTIKPRSDGCVIASLDDDTTYTFTPGEDGTLSCEVLDDAHVAYLVGTENFYPANPDDFAVAASLVADEGDEGVAEPDDTGDENAPLIEEPLRAKKKK